MKELDAFFWFKINRYTDISVVVAFTERARLVAMNRYGAWDLVVTWEEAKALARGLEKFPPEQRAVEMAKALRFFANRQGLDLHVRLT